MMLTEIGLELASAPPPEVRRGTLDVCVAVGNGGSEGFQPRLRLATGTPALAEAVVAGDLDFAFMNPSSLLTQAYRGTGIFAAPLPVQAVAVYPSWDRCVLVLHPRTGLTSLAEVRDRRYPLRLSIRADATHGTRTLLDQLLAAYEYTIADLEAWGGELQLVGTPRDVSRVNAIRADAVDAVFDEGISNWLDAALAAGMYVPAIEEAVLGSLEYIGWRRGPIAAGRFQHLREDCVAIDFSGWALYTRAALSDEAVYRVCAALAARTANIPWEETFRGAVCLGDDREASPRDVPLHPGAERWYSEHKPSAI
jgi:TRAP-type uncharacterized transport system substrate-binding protein